MAKQRPSYEFSLCAGHFMVWTWRKLLVRQEECPLLRAEYRRIAGPEADALLCLFATFLRVLGHGSRRILRLGQPYCAGLTTDEIQMLRLAAAAQAGDDTLLAAHLGWLVKPDGRPAALAAVQALMAQLRMCGVVLPPVAAALPPLRPMLELVWRGQEKSGGDAAGSSSLKPAYR